MCDFQIEDHVSMSFELIAFNLCFTNFNCHNVNKFLFNVLGYKLLVLQITNSNAVQLVDLVAKLLQSNFGIRVHIVLGNFCYPNNW
jgi:hypothetical protein